jgi:hypothetical protein
LRVIEGADTSLAGRIAGNLQPASEGEGGLGVDRLFQCELICIAYRRMEEAWTNIPIHFDYGGDPWGIADRSLRRQTFNVLPKASSNPS